MMQWAEDNGIPENQVLQAHFALQQVPQKKIEFHHQSGKGKKEKLIGKNCVDALEGPLEFQTAVDFRPVHQEDRGKGRLVYNSRGQYKDATADHRYEKIKT